MALGLREWPIWLLPAGSTDCCEARRGGGQPGNFFARQERVPDPACLAPARTWAGVVLSKMRQAWGLCGVHWLECLLSVRG